MFCTMLRSQRVTTQNVQTTQYPPTKRPACASSRACRGISKFLTTNEIPCYARDDAWFKSCKDTHRERRRKRQSRWPRRPNSRRWRTRYKGGWSCIAPESRIGSLRERYRWARSDCRLWKVGRGTCEVASSRTQFILARERSSNPSTVLVLSRASARVFAGDLL